MQRGQASLELIALLPIIVGAALVAVQVAGMLAASSTAQDRARARAMAASAPAAGSGPAGSAGAMLTVTGSARAPSLGGISPDRVRVAVAVRAP